MSRRTKTEAWPYARREFVGNVTNAASLGGLKVERVGTNPNSTTFPWLSQVTNAFETYKFKSLTFLYRPLTSNNTVSEQNSLGTVTLYFNYDAGDPVVQSRHEANNYQGSISARICDPIVMRVNCSKVPLYIRPKGALEINQDVREMDFGFLGVVVENVNSVAVGGVVGELWVEYECHLMKPKIDEGIGAGCQETVIYGPSTLNNNTGANGFGISPTVRRFQIDIFNSINLSSTFSTLIPHNVWPVFLRAGMIVEVRATQNFSTTTGNVGDITVSLNTTALSSLGIQLGTAVAQPKFVTNCDTAGNNPTYVSQFTVGINNQQIRQSHSCWRCTKEGIILFQTNFNQNPVGTLSATVISITLLNRPTYFKGLPLAERPTGWEQFGYSTQAS